MFYFLRNKVVYVLQGSPLLGALKTSKFLAMRQKIVHER